MAFCKYCGNQIDDDSVFCSRCGKRLSGTAQSGQYPPPPEPERQKPETNHSPEIETAAQRAQRYQNRTYQSNGSAGNTGWGSVNTGGSPAPKKSPMKFVIPAALMAFIVVLFIFNSIFNHSSGSRNKVVPTPSPAVSISIPPDLSSIKPTIKLPEGSPDLTLYTPEPSDGDDDEDEFYENIADNVVAVLSAITERSDYILGDYEPLIGVTDVNENGCAEILAVYETKDDGTYEVCYDVWSTDSKLTYRVMSGILYFEVGGNNGVVYLLQDPDGAPYVMLEQNMPAGEYFNTVYDIYKFSADETTVDFYSAWETYVRYDTEHGGIAEAKYYTYYSDRVEVSYSDFIQYFDNYTVVYSLDIVSGEYDWDNTISFDWAWKLFGQSR